MKAIILNASAWMIVPVMDAFAKYLRAINTVIGTVTNDIKVETTIVLEILSTFFFGEYIEATK